MSFLSCRCRLCVRARSFSRRGAAVCGSLRAALLRFSFSRLAVLVVRRVPGLAARGVRLRARACCLRSLGLRSAAGSVFLRAWSRGAAKKGGPGFPGSSFFSAYLIFVIEVKRMRRDNPRAFFCVRQVFGGAHPALF